MPSSVRSIGRSRCLPPPLLSLRQRRGASSAGGAPPGGRPLLPLREGGTLTSEGATTMVFFTLMWALCPSVGNLLALASMRPCYGLAPYPVGR